MGSNTYVLAKPRLGTLPWEVRLRAEPLPTPTHVGTHTQFPVQEMQFKTMPWLGRPSLMWARKYVRTKVGWEMHRGAGDILEVSYTYLESNVLRTYALT